MPVDPAVRDLLAAWGEPGEFDLVATRKAFDVLDPEVPGRFPVASVTDSEIGGVPVRTYEPAGPAVTPPLVWFHGGGFVAGTLNTVDPLCRMLTISTAAPVISVGYRLAPEHPFPAALDDCVAVVRGAGATGRIAVGGDSAGGGLAASVCQAVAGEGLPIAAQVLMNPLLDATLSFPSMDECATGFGLTRRNLEHFVELYVGGADPADPRCSPVLAPSLSGLPPAVIVTAEYDPLRDEGEAYARRLSEAGVTVRVRRWDSMVHGFVGLSGVTPAADEALTWITHSLRALAAF